MSSGMAAGVTEHDRSSTIDRYEPRWLALVALLAVGVLRLAIPDSLAVGPGWLLIPVIAVLAVPTIWARRRGYHDLNAILGYTVTSIVTADMIWSLYLLVAALPQHRISPVDLLRAAAAL